MVAVGELILGENVGVFGPMKVHVPTAGEIIALAASVALDVGVQTI